MMRPRMAALSAAGAVLAVTLAACGGGSDEAASEAAASQPAASQPAESAAASQAPSSEAASVSTAALDEAKARVDLLLSNPPLDLAPLSVPAEKGLKVASVNCNIPACKPGEFQKAAGVLGWDAAEEIYDLAKGPADFVSAVRRALQSKPDAMAILFVYPPDLVADELKQAQEEGVELVAVGASLEEPPPGFLSCVACIPGYVAYGSAQADFVAVDAGGATEVGVIGDKTISANIETSKYLTQQFEVVAPGTGVTMIEASYSQTPQENAQAIVTAVQRNPNMKYLMFQGPDFMVGVDQALSAAGLKEQVKVVGIDPSGPENVMLADTGEVYAWVAGDATVIWWRAIDVIARNQSGDAVDPAPGPALRIITKGNVAPDMFAPPEYEAAFAQAWGVG